MYVRSSFIASTILIIDKRGKALILLDMHGYWNGPSCILKIHREVSRERDSIERERERFEKPL